jgi:hypothetical protein
LIGILQHFAVATIPTICSGVPSQTAWRVILPSLAAKYTFLTHGMLAAASLHLAHLASTKQELDEYEQIAAAQMNEGMSGYRIQIQNISTENADALFAFSTTMTVFTLSTAATDCGLMLKVIRNSDSALDQQAATTSSLVQSICRVFHSIRGVLVILVPCWEHLSRGVLGVVVERPWWPGTFPVTSEELRDDQKLRHLETMWSRPGRAYDYSFDTLRIALKVLRESFALVSRLESLAHSNEETAFDWTSTLHWPTQITREFLALLENKSMEAWVLVAHFAMLPAKVEGILWLDGLATNIITTAALVIGEKNWEWLAWPAIAVRVDLDCVRSSTTTRQSAPSEIPKSISQLPPSSATHSASCAM